MFVDEMQDAALTDAEWKTATNYRPTSTGIDLLAITVDNT
jgi:hypothetical protein